MALLDQAQAGLGRAGIEASEALAGRLDGAGNALDGLSARIAEQERASQRLIADLDLGLVALDDRFARLAQQGDERAQRISGLVALFAATSTSSATIPGRRTRRSSRWPTVPRRFVTESRRCRWP